jgi:hypothetical protein
MTTPIHLLVFVAALLLCAAPAWKSRKFGEIFITDFFLLFSPTIAFFWAVVTYNIPAQTGLALIVYPGIVLALSTIPFALRVFALKGLSPPRIWSAIFLVASCAIATYFSSIIAPWPL